MKPSHGLIMVLALAAAAVSAKGEYNSKYLYAEVDAKNKGGLRIKLTGGKHKISRVVAIGRRSDKPYLGAMSADQTKVTFKHLPIDRYDLMIVADQVIFEGIQLVRKSEPNKVEQERKALVNEVRGVEGFFEGKEVLRLEIQNQKACCLVQQWRIGAALAESGAVLKGTVRSIDLFTFEKPWRGWQLVNRRQLYREETPRQGPLQHQRLEALGNLRVLRTVKDVGIELPPVKQE